MSVKADGPTTAEVKCTWDLKHIAKDPHNHEKQ